jgi:drug/metabolite transporter (DMT)-like permease
MSWQIAIALSILANVTTILVERRYAQKSVMPATFATAISYVCGVIPLGLFAGLVVFPHQINWSGHVILLMALLGSAMAIANWLGFVVAKKLNVAALLIMRRVTSVMVIVLAWTILGETLTMAQFIGGTILLLAATLAIFAPVKNTALRIPCHSWRGICGNRASIRKSFAWAYGSGWRVLN